MSVTLVHLDQVGSRTGEESTLESTHKLKTSGIKGVNILHPYLVWDTPRNLLQPYVLQYPVVLSTPPSPLQMYDPSCKKKKKDRTTVL